ncbi:MAG: fibronectin type III domain-containing protein, partial [Lentisphaerae bacterium]|nr:fibronectin type III domain-containing protein [Lentisphaerota bacterium]
MRAADWLLAGGRCAAPEKGQSGPAARDERGGRGVESRRGMRGGAMRRGVAAVVAGGLLAGAGTAMGQTTLLSETLRTGSAPSGWSAVDITWATAAQGYAHMTAQNTSTITTPKFDASAHASVRVNLSVAKYGTGGDGPVTVEYSLDDGSTWTTAGSSDTPSGTTYLNSQVNISAASATMRIRFNRSNSASQKRLRDIVIQGIGTAANPTITLSGSPTAFSTTVGTPSAAQQLTVSGSDLSGDITVTAPTGFEVSKTLGSGYDSSIAFTPSSGTVASSTVYVRLTGASAGSFSGNVAATSTGATTKNVAVSGTTSAAGCGDYWHALYNRGAQIWTNYLGDNLLYQFEFALNQDTTGYTVEYGLGRNTTGSGWTWRGADWSRMDGNDNRVWISKQNEQQFTDTGNWYFAGRFSKDGCTWYADGDWEHTTGGGFTAESYFLVVALNNPSGQSATRNSGSPTSQIDLSWSKNAQGHNVMVVRKASGTSWTEPTQGTSYSAGASLGSGTVVYNGSGTSFNNTGLAADTAYDYKFYSVNNNYYSAGVTASASTMAAEPAASPTTLSFSAFSTTGMTINWSGVSTKVLVVVRASSDLSAHPVDGTTYTANANYGGGGTALGGGKVVYKGTGTSVALTGLSAGTVYYVRIYNFNGGDGAENYRTTSPLAGSKITCTEIPTVAAATAVGGSGFTANWSAVTGASGYRLDVSTSPTFTGGSVNLMTNPGFETGNLTSWTNNGGSDITIQSTDPQEGSYNALCAPSATRHFGQAVTIAGDGVTEYENSYWYKGSGNVRIWASWASGGVVSGDNLQPGSYNGNAASWTKMTYKVVPNNGQNVLNYQLRIYNGASISLDNFFVGTSSGGGPAFVSGYENLAVAGTSQVVTGLEQDTKYYYRVRAENDSCVSENSGTQEVTTAAATPTIVLGNNGTQVAAAEVGAGKAAVVLHKSQLAVTTAKAVLTGVSFTSAGTYAATDIANFKVWYSADNTLETGSDTLLGTITASLGTGSHSLSSLNQTINAGNTGYIFITADIAATPTGGKTISVSALTTGNFTFTAGNKSGSTTAGGAQTIVTLPTLTTPTATGIGQTTATLGANVTGLGGAAALDSRGTVWGTGVNPTGNKTAVTGTGTGDFTHERTGLGQGTKIYYRGYADNAAGTGYSAQGSFFTEPGQASNVNIDPITATGMKISWTAGANADGAIVVVRAGNAAVTAPTDGTLHSANAAFGSGADLGSGSYVVYRGSGTSVEVTGLTAGTTYYVEVFAYKGTVATSGVDQGINYRQTSPATGSALTCPAAPEIGEASQEGSSSFRANWSAVDGATGYRLDVSLSEDFETKAGSFEDFESGLPEAYTATTTYMLSSGTWYGQANGIIRGTVGAVSGSYSCQIRSQTGAFIATPKITGGVGEVSFVISASTASGAYQVNISTDDGQTWSGSSFTVGTTPQTRTIQINRADVNRIQIYRTAATIYVDDFEWEPVGGGGFVDGYEDLDVENVTSYLVEGLDSETTYYYRVRAENASCVSAYSEVESATTKSLGELIALWGFYGLENGGTSPMAATDRHDDVTVGGLTRGPGVTVPGSAAGNAWGGVGFNHETKAAAITAGSYATFTVTAKPGYVLSLGEIAPYNIRRSATGPTTGQWQYQVDSGGFVDLDSELTWGDNVAAAGNPQAAIDLSAISALQDLAAGSVVTFRVVSWGATQAGGTWYFNEQSAGKSSLTVRGLVVEAPISEPSAPTITGITPGNAQLEVAFSAPGDDGGSEITDYKYSTDGGTTWKSAGKATSPLTITTVSSGSGALVNGTTYSVRIRAVNAAG